jgi:hypothetical protein
MCDSFGPTGPYRSPTGLCGDCSLIFTTGTKLRALLSQEGLEHYSRQELEEHAKEGCAFCFILCVKFDRQRSTRGRLLLHALTNVGTLIACRDSQISCPIDIRRVSFLFALWQNNASYNCTIDVRFQDGMALRRQASMPICG